MCDKHQTCSHKVELLNALKLLLNAFENCSECFNEKTTHLSDEEYEKQVENENHPNDEAFKLIVRWAIKSGIDLSELQAEIPTYQHMH